MTGWKPSEAQSRWRDMENALKGWNHDTQPLPHHLVVELIAVARALAVEHNRMIDVVSRMRHPWGQLRGDMNELAAILGSGWAPSDPNTPGT